LGDRVLVVASWGYAPSWRKVMYRISIDHPAFRDASALECESCSSTLVLVEYLLSKGFDIDLMIFGADSVVDPSKLSSGEELRKAVLDAYRSWFEELLRECSCCNALHYCLDDACSEDRRVRVFVDAVPGAGHFYGWRFRGGIDHAFNKVFARVLSALASGSYKWLFMDLTHGINYQMVATLYACVAASIVTGMDRRVIEVNSTSTAAMRSEPCIKGYRTPSVEAVPQLDILDVTKLQEAMGVIRGLSALRNLDTSIIKSYAGYLRRVDREAAELVDRVTRFVDLVRNGAVAAAFVNACTNSKCPVANPCPGLASESISAPSYVPSIDSSAKVVSYERASVAQALKQAITHAVSRMCNEYFNAETLTQLMRCVARLYESSKLRICLNIANRTLEELSEFLRELPNILDPIEGPTYVDVTIFRLFSELKHEKSIDLKKVAKVINEHAADVEKAKRIDTRTVRNFLAHAGLEYALVKGFIVDRVKDGNSDKIDIVKVLYRNSVEKVIERIQR